MPETTHLKPTRAAATLMPYTPGRDPAPIELRLDRNERAVPPAAIARALAGVTPSLCAAYPDKQPLERALATRSDVSPDRVLVTAGGDDAIDRCCRAMLLPGSRIVMHTPSFEMIARSAVIAGGCVEPIEWLNGPFPKDAVLNAIDEDTRLVAIVSPNNPTGLEVPIESVLRIAQAAPHALVLLDLAYIEFAQSDPMAAALSEPNIVCVRTFSKAYGLAGMRLGYAVGSPQVINWLRTVGGPYPTSAAGLYIAEALLKDEDDLVDQYVDRVRRERAELERFLAANGFDVWPGNANFLLVRRGDASDIHRALAERGIAVRAFNEPASLADCLRITCPGDEHSFDRLLQALDDILGENSP